MICNYQNKKATLLCFLQEDSIMLLIYTIYLKVIFISQKTTFVESMNKNEIIHSSLIRPIAKLLVRKSKSQFRLLNDPDSDNCENYKMNGQKVTIYDDKLLSRDTGVVFTSKRDIRSMITDYDFYKQIHLMRNELLIFWMKCILIYIQKVKF